MKKFNKVLNKILNKILIDYPTVYIINDKSKNNRYQVYVGETNDIVRRTFEHIDVDKDKDKEWRKLNTSLSTKMFIIGHEHFNKSLTLDIENKLMLYLSSVESVETISNKRTNQQGKYYTSDEMEEIFSKIWRKLSQKNRMLFPTEKIVRDLALFKAFPFHKLTLEQEEAKYKILKKIFNVFNELELSN